MFCFGTFADKISGVVYNDLTGNFPFMSIDGSVCFFILYHYETNAILVRTSTIAAFVKHIRRYLRP